MEEEEDLKICENCQQQFPSYKIDLHEAYCRRHIRKCKHCATMIDINDEETHNNQFHVEHPCEFCSIDVLVTEIERHRGSCLQRPIQCKHCQNPYPFAAVSKHEDECGSRTRRCQICRKYIKINQFEQHASNCRVIEIPRNDSHQERRVPHVRERMNSNDNVKRQVMHVNSPRMPKMPSKTIVIGPESINQMVDPVPISVRITMQREREKGRHK